MSKQPSELAMQIARAADGHQYDCVLSRGNLEPGDCCTCNLDTRQRHIALAIDAAIAAARDEAYEKAARLIETQYRREPDTLRSEDAKCDACGVRSRVRQRDAAAIRALAAQEARDGK